MAQLFIEFARDQKDINPRDIVSNYQQVQDKVRGLVEDRNMSKLGELVMSFSVYLSTSMPKYTHAELKNIMNFLLDLPVDTAAYFVAQIDSLERNSEAYKYITKIHVTLMELYPEYKAQFYEPLVGVLSSHEN